MSDTATSKPPAPSAPAWLRALHRWGGVLVAPRATMAELPAQQGGRDGLWLGLLYLIGTSVYPLAEALASLVAIRNLGGLIAVLSVLGRALLVPILAVVAAEVLLGSGRTHRRGLALIPVVIVGTGVHAARQLGIQPVGGTWMWTIAAAVIGVGLMWWLRDSVPVNESGEGQLREAMKSKWTLAMAVGGLFAAAALCVGAVDGYHAARNWDRLGPLPPGKAAPAFRLATLEGGTFTREDLQGQVTVMTFWATWCGACKGELEDLDEVDDQFRERDVQFVAVNWEGARAEPSRLRAHVQRHVQARGLQLPVALDDGTMARELRVGPIPHTVIFDERGVLRYIHQGRVRTSTLLEEIEALEGR